MLFTMMSTSLVKLFANSGVALAPNSGGSAGGELDTAGEAFLLFWSFVLLMGVFVFFIALMVLRRWIHRRNQVPVKDESKLPDPWQEAGHRAEPFNQPSQDS